MRTVLYAKKLTLTYNNIQCVYSTCCALCRAGLWNTQQSPNFATGVKKMPYQRAIAWNDN